MEPETVGLSWEWAVRYTETCLYEHGAPMEMGCWMDTGPARTQSLYRKYRPETFDGGELVGQDHVRDTLRNAISTNRVSHAYLFCGPRGTGKTTTARLLAKAVNCLDPDPAKRPCNVCDACVAINSGRATDIVEIDAASNRGIEDIRDLRERVKYAPTQLRHKFYIIDEAHRLTRDAFNAFLKTLEEPPPNTTFVLATTDPDELLETVASRCQRFDFHRIPAREMAERVRTVCEREGIQIDEEALEIVIRQSTGSLRDALSLIDMLATATQDGEQQVIDAPLTRRMLGLSQNERTLGLIEAIADRDLKLGLETINDAVDSGQDMRAFGRQIQSALRLLMLCSAGASPAEADDALKRIATRFELPDLLRINREFSEIDYAIRTGGFPQLPIEIAFVASILVEPPATAALPADVREPVTSQAQALRPPTERPAPRLLRTDQAEPRTNREESRPTPIVNPPVEQLDRRPQPSQIPPGESASPGSAQVFVERWQEIRTQVKAADRKVEALLASTDPQQVVDGTLYLLAAYPFHAGKLNEDRNRATIEDAVYNITGQRVTISTVLRDEVPVADNDPSTPPATPTSTPGPRRISERPPSSSDSPLTNDEEEDQTGQASAEEQQVMERVKALFNGEEVDVDDLPVDLT